MCARFFLRFFCSDISRVTLCFSVHCFASFCPIQNMSGQHSKPRAPSAANTDTGATVISAITTKEQAGTTASRSSHVSANKPTYTLADALREASAESSGFLPKRRGRPRKSVPSTQPHIHPELALQPNAKNDEPSRSPPRKKTAAQAKYEFCITVKYTVPAGNSVIVRIE